MRRALQAGLWISAALLPFLFIHVPVALAWAPNGSPLCTAAGDQVLPVTVSDGAGGVIVVWHDARSGGAVYAQRVNGAGVPQWAADGVPLSTSGDLNTPVAGADGAGGAFVAFGGSASPPRAQRVDGAGVPQWGPNGVALTTTAGTRELAITPDLGGTGGAFVAWRLDGGKGGTADVLAQKLNAAGAVQWGPQGIPIADTNMNDETVPSVLSDDVGGAFFAWIGGAGVRTQRFDGAGASLWNVAILAASGNKVPPAMVSDGANGAIVAWAGGGAFIQRVTANGSRIWGVPNGGFTLSTTGRSPTLISDGASGAIVTWEDNRSTTNFNLYAMRLDAGGSLQWLPHSGAPICEETKDQRNPQIVSDGGGGAIISWYDARTDQNSGTDIYAQRINGTTGAPQWTTNGIALCTAPANQDFPTMASDGAGGACVAWEDLRNGAGNSDIYATRINSSGAPLSVPSGPIGAGMARVGPAPFSDRVALDFVLAAATAVRTKVLDLGGRVVADLGSASLAKGPQRITWDGRTSDGHTAGGGVYFIRVEGPGLSLSRRVLRLK